MFVTAAQAGKGPDLVMGAHDWIGNLVQNGTIDPCSSPTTPGPPSTRWPSRA